MAGPRRPSYGRSKSVPDRRREDRSRRQSQGSGWVDPGNPFGVEGTLSPDQRRELEAAYQAALGGTDQTEYWNNQSGLRVRLSRAAGYTAKGLLETPFRFQVPPMEEFSQQYAFDHSEYTTLKSGMFTRPTSRQLIQIQFQTMFLDYNVEWEAWHTKDSPIDATRDLRRLVNTGTPFRLFVRNPALWADEKPDVDMLAVLKSLTVSEKAGEPDARYVDVAFQEWRPPEVIKRKQLGKKTKDKQKRPGRSQPKTPATVWVHPSGECNTRNKKWTASKPVTLNGLAVYFYGRSAYWRTIARKNNIEGVASKDNLGTYVTRVNNGKALKLTIPKLNKDS